MLVDIHTECPDCGAMTLLAVSNRKDNKSAVSVTHCRVCNARIITATSPDGHVFLKGQRGERVISLNSPKKSSGPEGIQIHVTPAERFGLFDAEYANPLEISGIADEELEKSSVIQHGPEILFRPDGSRRTERELISKIGWRGLWLSQLHFEFSKRQSGPPAMMFPPGIFISYRWQDNERNRWVADLASALKSRGYMVVFDRDEPQTEKPDIPKMVSRIADCRYFLAVMDPGYAERIGDADSGAVRDGWVFDEHQCALNLSNAGRLRIVGLIREGEPGSQSFRIPEIGRSMGNAVDVRTAEHLLTFLDHVFPELPVKNDNATVLAARDAIQRSHEAYCANDPEAAIAAAAEVGTLIPQSPDGNLQIVRITLRSGHSEVGLQAAEAALRQIPQSIELLMCASNFAARLSRPKDSARFAVAILDQREERPLDRAQAHVLVASALDDLGRPDVALGHNRCAVKLCPDTALFENDLGYMLRRLGRPEEAFEVFKVALAKAPLDRLLTENGALAAREAGDFESARDLVQRLVGLGCEPRRVKVLSEIVSNDARSLIERVDILATDRVVRCSGCAVEIFLAPDETEICAGCGAPRATLSDTCGYCGFEGTVPLIPGLVNALCPFCANGAIAIEVA